MKKILKRAISIILTSCFVLNLGVPVFASELEDINLDVDTQTLGLRMNPRQTLD